MKGVATRSPGRANSSSGAFGRLLARVDHGHDVGMAEPRDRAGLPPEALELVGIGGDLAVHQLDRDRPLEHRVEGPVDGRHAAAPDRRLEAVAPREGGAERVLGHA